MAFSPSPELLAKLNRAERRMNELLPDIERCERCNLNMEKVREILEENQVMIQRIKKEFYSNQSHPMTQPLSTGGG